MRSPDRRVTLALSLFALGLVLAALITVWATDGPRLWAVVGRLEAGPLVLALLFMAVSYLAIALSFAALFRIGPHALGFDAVDASFMSSAFGSSRLHAATATRASVGPNSLTSRRRARARGPWTEARSDCRRS